jgi:PD-(D/E)XK endonuclease
MMTMDQKGGVAELAITLAAVRLGVDVYRPVVEGGRYDLIFGFGSKLVRVQCKWAPLEGDVIVIRGYSADAVGTVFSSGDTSPERSTRSRRTALRTTRATSFHTTYLRAEPTFRFASTRRGTTSPQA